MSGSISIPGVPASLAVWQREVERRLEVLETASRLYNSAIREGTLRIQDSSGNPMVTLGKLDDGTYGMLIQKSDGNTVQRVSSDGKLVPRQSLPMVSSFGGLVSGLPNGFRPGTTQGAYTELWRSDFMAQGTEISFDLFAFANLNTMDVQFTMAQVGMPLVQAFEQTGISSNVQVSSHFTIPAAALISGTDPVGKNMSMRINARKTASGANPTVDILLNAVPICYNP